MELLEIVRQANLNTDEDFDLMDVISWINDAVAKINVEVRANFPFVDTTLPEQLYAMEEYDALPDTWIRMLIVPFVAGRIKENDSSQFEYNDWYGQFDMNLEKFRTSYRIPLEYQDLTAEPEHSTEDFHFNMFSPTKGW